MESQVTTEPQVFLNVVLGVYAATGLIWFILEFWRIGRPITRNVPLVIVFVIGQHAGVLAMDEPFVVHILIPIMLAPLPIWLLLELRQIGRPLTRNLPLVAAWLVNGLIFLIAAEPPPSGLIVLSIFALVTTPIVLFTKKPRNLLNWYVKRHRINDAASHEEGNG